LLEKCAGLWNKMREESPLVHCMTNYVTMNDVANIILSGGASPAMVDHPEEVVEFAGMSQAIYMNFGTLTTEKETAMLQALEIAWQKQVPVILDPVACGGIMRKARIAKYMMETGGLTCIKGNSAEIKSLAGFQTISKGVDSLDDGKGIEEACRVLADKAKLVVAATGAVDTVVDDQRLARIKNGTPLFKFITGAGCMVAGLIAACIGSNRNDPWLAAVTGLLAFNIAGEKSAQKVGHNPGSFHLSLFDCLYHIKGEDIIKEAKVEWQ